MLCCAAVAVGDLPGNERLAQSFAMEVAAEHCGLVELPRQLLGGGGTASVLLGLTCLLTCISASPGVSLTTYLHVTLEARRHDLLI